MIRIFRGCLIAAALLSVSLAAAVSEYRTFFAATRLADGTPAIVIRRFTRDHHSYGLLLRPRTLATEIAPLAGLEIAPAPLEDLRREFAKSPYDLALAEAAANSGKLQDAGITHSLPAERGISLTIDLCPSQKTAGPFPVRRHSGRLRRQRAAHPLAIAVSGIWMEKTRADLRWLAGLARSGRVTIDWIDHSYHHQYDPRLPLRRNFLLEKGVDLNEEVLKTEEKMMACGLTPSIFFRFPGLVSDQAEIMRTLALGLIPVGSDAWLAKKQKPGPGASSSSTATATSRWASGTSSPWSSRSSRPSRTRTGSSSTCATAWNDPDMPPGGRLAKTTPV